MAARIQIRRDFSTNWTSNNPILTEGELGYELDTGKLKVGNGVTPWNTLGYFQETVNYSDVIDPPRNLSYFNNDAGYLLNSSPAGSITEFLKTNWSTAFSWGDHSVAGYLPSTTAATTYLTQTSAATTYQPVDGDLTSIAGISGTAGLLRKTAANTWSLDTTTYLTSTDTAAGISPDQIANWDTAFSWGNHADEGYLTVVSAQTTYQPVDGDLTSIAGISGTAGLLRKTAANTWSLDTTTYLSTGDAATTYLTQTSAATTYLSILNAATSYQPLDADLSSIAALSSNAGLLRKTAANTWSLDTTTYLTSTDTAAGISSGQIANWDAAFGWGDHAAEGYLLSTSAATTYLTQTSAATTYLTQTSAATTYLTQSSAATTYQPVDGDLTSIAGISGTAGLLRKTAANTWSLDTTTYLSTGDAATTYQPVDGDLTSIAGISGTAGLLRKTAANTWSLDTDSYTKIVNIPLSGPDSVGSAGTIAYDTSYLYVCVDTNTWKRIAWDTSWI